MKTKAIRLYGKKDLRLEEFELPLIGSDEILAHVISDSICMSSYKAAGQGSDHKRVPGNISKEPVIIGHEFCGVIKEVGKKWQKKYQPGDKFSIQPALNYEHGPVGILSAPGYSYRYLGGDATMVIIPDEVMTHDCLLPYRGEGYFPASLSEPMSCIIGAFHASYHTRAGSYVHEMGIKKNGSMAILAGAGPMGLGAIDYALHGPDRPSLLVVTDIDDARLDRAKSLFPVKNAEDHGVKLFYTNTKKLQNPVSEMRILSGKDGFDDVMVFAPVRPVVEQADALLGRDGCLNFFAGPTDPEFRAELNFYNVHYNAAHITGTSGGNTDDMKESLALMAKDKIRPQVMVTHIGGLDAVIETTLNLPAIPGGKKLIYNNISLPLTAIDSFPQAGNNNPLFKNLSEITDRNNGLWSLEAEEYLLKNAPGI